MEVLIATLSLVVAILTLWYGYFRKPKEELQHLKAQFRATQSLSKELQTELEDFINITHCGEDFIFQNVSYSAYLNLLKDSYQENLSDDLFFKLDKLNLTKNIINSMIKSLEKQFSELQKMLIEIKIRKPSVD